MVFVSFKDRPHGYSCAINTSVLCAYKHALVSLVLYTSFGSTKGAHVFGWDDLGNGLGRWIDSLTELGFLYFCP